MSKPAGTKATTQSLNKSAASGPGAKGVKGAKGPKAGDLPTAGGKGDRDGKGDIRAKKANTSSAKKSASK